MATYNLDAADLVTLLRSTVQPTTAGEILTTLINNGEFPGPIDSLKGVETILGPSGGSPITTQDDLIGGGTDLTVITIPTSTSDPTATFPAPTIDSQSHATNFNFLSPGGVFIAAGDQFVSINDYNFNSKADILIGGAGKEKLTSKTGSNELIAGTGTNTLQGGYQNDTLIGGGQSRLLAGGGNNLLIGGTVSGAHDTLIGGSGPDTLRVTEGNNRLVAGGVNTLYGGSGNDSLVGAAGASMVGGTGNTRLVARAGAETLVAGQGLDTLVATSTSASLTVSLGSGFALVRDIVAAGGSLLGASATIAGGTAGGHVVLGSTGSDSIVSGSGAISILSTQAKADLVGNTGSGASHTLTFANGQTIVVNDLNSNVTIHFATGGSTAV